MLNNLTFSEAMDAVKSGRRIARPGWNGKGMFVFIKPGSVPPMADWPNHKRLYGVPTTLFEIGDHNSTVRFPCLCLSGMDQQIVEGWAPSQADMMAEDWSII